MINGPEEWQNLNRPGGYAASSLGRVRRNSHVDARGMTRTNAILTPFYRHYKKAPATKSKVGFVRLAGGQIGPQSVPVPQLVAEAWLREYDQSFHAIQFGDGDHGNWELANIRLRPKFAVQLEQRLTNIAQQATGGEANAE